MGSLYRRKKCQNINLIFKNLDVKIHFHINSLKSTQIRQIKFSIGLTTGSKTINFKQILLYNIL